MFKIIRYTKRVGQVSRKVLIEYLRRASDHVIGTCPCSLATDWERRVIEWNECQGVIQIILGHYNATLASMFNQWAKYEESKEKLS